MDMTVEAALTELRHDMEETVDDMDGDLDEAINLHMDRYFTRLDRILVDAGILP